MRRKVPSFVISHWYQGQRAIGSLCLYVCYVLILLFGSTELAEVCALSHKPSTWTIRTLRVIFNRPLRWSRLPWCWNRYRCGTGISRVSLHYSHCFGTPPKADLDFGQNPQPILRTYLHSWHPPVSLRVSRSCHSFGMPNPTFHFGISCKVPFTQASKSCQMS